MSKPISKQTTTRVKWEEILKLDAGDRVVVTITKGGAQSTALDFTVDAGAKLRGTIAISGTLA